MEAENGKVPATDYLGRVSLMKSPWEGTMRVTVACCISLSIGVHTAWAQPHPGETAYGKVCVTCHGPEGSGHLFAMENGVMTDNHIYSTVPL